MHMLLTFILPPESPRFYQFQLDHWNALYEWTSFDYFILVPYLTILGILAIYGLHRYHLVYLYLRNKDKVAKPAGHFSNLPRVTVQLPIFNEMYVVERLIEAACRIRYPIELLEIQVLDDSTDGTTTMAAACVAQQKALGFQIEHIHRTHRDGFKAGALENGLKVATGDYIAIFDADFLPAENFLHDVIHYFT